MGEVAQDALALCAPVLRDLPWNSSRVVIAWSVSRNRSSNFFRASTLTSPNSQSHLYND